MKNLRWLAFIAFLPVSPRMIMGAGTAELLVFLIIGDLAIFFYYAFNQVKVVRKREKKS